MTPPGREPRDPPEREKPFGEGGLLADVARLREVSQSVPPKTMAWADLEYTIRRLTQIEKALRAAALSGGTPYTWTDYDVVTEMASNMALEAVNAADPSSRKIAQDLERRLDDLARRIAAPLGERTDASGGWRRPAPYRLRLHDE